MVAMNHQMFEDLLAEVASGTPVANWIRADENRPSKAALMKWIRADPNREKLLREAYTLGAESMVDDAVDIADHDSDYGAQRAAVRLKVAAIRNARMREQQQLTISGDKDNPIGLSPELALQQLLQLYALAKARAGTLPLAAPPTVLELLE